jgi:hypothetical protein
VIVLLVKIIIVLASLLVLLIETFIGFKYICIWFALYSRPINFFSLNVVLTQRISDSITHGILMGDTWRPEVIHSGNLSITTS